MATQPTQEALMHAVYEAADRLIDYACERLDLDVRDIDWARNRLFEPYNIDSYEPTGAVAGERDGATVAQEFADALIAAGLADDAVVAKDLAMGTVSVAPSVIDNTFADLEQRAGAMQAMHWFYDYCVDNTYVKRRELQRNVRFESHGLIITINVAKPEFRTSASASKGNGTAGGYPACTICHENEGFGGRDKRTLRTIPVALDGHAWFWQYSPYGYFYEHGICVNTEHTPMHVDAQTFSNLFDFVERFPDFFLGCNAALPRIGGSVLAHDHYQGGGEIMPMHKADVWATLTPTVDGHMLDDTVVEILDWAGTAMRVVSKDRAHVQRVCEAIRQAWVHYDNAEFHIASHDEHGAVQSSLSPSAIISERGYEMSLILRNNAVSAERPEGIFHADPKYFFIKQEAIGLIEAQGLFILPGRLINQLHELEQALIERKPLPDDLQDFKLGWDEITRYLSGHGDDRTPQTVQAAVREELGSICERILHNTAVFKDKRDTLRFLENIGFVQQQ